MIPWYLSRVKVELAGDIIRLEIRLWDLIDERLRERHDLPLSFFESLYFLQRAPDEGLRVGDLAHALAVTVGGTSKLVDRIEAAGLIARSPDPDDRRASRVTLTPLGRRTVRAAIRTYEAEITELVDGVLSDGDQKRLHSYVGRLLGALEERRRR